MKLSKRFVSWHQDNTYWGLSSRNVVTAWFAISDASVEAGCMQVMPGTHLGDTLSHEDTCDEDNMLTRGQSIRGVSMHFMPPQTTQVVGAWDCAALVHGTDRLQRL